MGLLLYNTGMIVVTTGEAYADIDAFACALAYRDLLRLRGIRVKQPTPYPARTPVSGPLTDLSLLDVPDLVRRRREKSASEPESERGATEEGWLFDSEAEVVFPGPVNQSVTPLFRMMGSDVLAAPSEAATGFVVMDLSDPDYIAKFVDQARIVKLFDHHFGFEEYWKTRLGEKAIIEHIGACATLIWEEYRKQGLEKSITTDNANLLAAAIVSNTLNFRSTMTHDRDRVAFEELKNFTSLPPTWVADYFHDQERNILADIPLAIATDVKVLEVRELGMPMAIGQMELWNGKDFIATNREMIVKILSSFGKAQWFMSVPSISEDKNYFYAENATMRDVLARAIGAKFDGAFGTTDKLWMRKEILREFATLK